MTIAADGEFLPKLTVREAEGDVLNEVSPMQLEYYFEFISADEILLGGTRIGDPAILIEYLEGGFAGRKSRSITRP